MLGLLLLVIGVLLVVLALAGVLLPQLVWALVGAISGAVGALLLYRGRARDW